MCFPCRHGIKSRGQHCPVCRARLSEARNFALEQLLETLPRIKCRHRGCPFARTDGQLVNEHEKECVYRPFRCYFCPSSGESYFPMTELDDHVYAVHNEPCFPPNIDEYSRDLGWFDNGAMYRSLGQHRFFVFSMFHDGMTMFWVESSSEKLFCGSQRESEKYEYILKIHGNTRSQSGRGFVQTNLYTGGTKCVLGGRDLSSIKSEGKALFLGRGLLKTAAEQGSPQGDFVNFALTIKPQRTQVTMDHNPHRRSY